jgi:hypothetical protein
LGGGCGVAGPGADSKVLALLSEQDLPPAEMPSASATPAPGAVPETAPGAVSSPEPDDSNDANWTGAPAGAAPTNSAGPSANAPSEQGAQTPPQYPPGTAGPGAAPAHPGTASSAQGAPQATPTEAPPPYDVGSVVPAPQVSDQPLTPLIKAAQSQPTLSASLRAAEQARQALGASRLDDAIRDLGYAVSIDPTDPYAYFYLGRAYMMKKDCPQALAFFGRSEVGLRTVPEWLGEAKSFEGACLEEQGKFAQAATDYKQALDLSPGNLRARAGYGRVSSSLSDANAATSPPPSANSGASLSEPTVDAGAVRPPPQDSSAITPPPPEPPPSSVSPDSSGEDN